MTPTPNLNIHNSSSNPLIPCLYPGCNCWFKTFSGLTCHEHSKHFTLVIPEELLDSHSNSNQHSDEDPVNIYFIITIMLNVTNLHM